MNLEMRWLDGWTPRRFPYRPLETCRQPRGRAFGGAIHVDARQRICQYRMRRVQVVAFTFTTAPGFNVGSRARTFGMSGRM